MTSMETERVVVTYPRKVWRPSSGSETVVVSLPPNTDFKVGDRVKVSVTSLNRIIVEKEVT